MNLLKNRKFLIGGVTVIVILILAFIFWPRGSSQNSIRQTSTVTKGTIVQKVEASGQVSSLNIQNAGFSTAGKITAINVAAGDAVKKGQTLASIDTTTLQNQLNQSQSSLDQAQNNLKNLKLKGRYTDYDILNLQEQIKSAQAKVASDQANLDNATLRAQIDGTVLKINSNVGDSVSGSGSNSQDSSTSQQSAVMVIEDTQHLIVTLSISDADISKLKKDQISEITFDSIKNKTYTGKVIAVDLLGQTSSGVVSYNVRILFDKPDADIRIGMNANASIITQTKSDILVVPTNYIKTVNGVKTVTVVENNKDVPKEVQVGLSDDTNTEITGGLSENDVIVRVTSLTTSTGAARSNTLQGLGGATGARGGATFIQTK